MFMDFRCFVVTKAQMDALLEGPHWQSAVQIFDRLGLEPELTWVMLIQDVGR